jgi:hypothetical protein
MKFMFHIEPPSIKTVPLHFCGGKANGILALLTVALAKSGPNSVFSLLKILSGTPLGLRVSLD